MFKWILKILGFYKSIKIKTDIGTEFQYSEDVWSIPFPDDMISTVGLEYLEKENLGKVICPFILSYNKDNGTYLGCVKTITVYPKKLIEQDLTPGKRYLTIPDFWDYEEHLSRETKCIVFKTMTRGWHLIEII